MNPGPSDLDLSSSFGSINSTSTTVSNFIHNSVSFLSWYGLLQKPPLRRPFYLLCLVEMREICIQEF
jgi:hypothetical protein